MAVSNRHRREERAKCVNQRIAAAFAVPQNVIGPEPTDIDPDWEIKAHEARLKEKGIIEPRRRPDAVAA